VDLDIGILLSMCFGGTENRESGIYRNAITK